MDQSKPPHSDLLALRPLAPPAATLYVRNGSKTRLCRLIRQCLLSREEADLLRSISGPGNRRLLRRQSHVGSGSSPPWWCWQSAANPSPGEFPANREIYSQFRRCVPILFRHLRRGKWPKPSHFIGQPLGREHESTGNFEQLSGKSGRATGIRIADFIFETRAVPRSCRFKSWTRNHLYRTRLHIRC